jgi:hypothetical protein
MTDAHQPPHQEGSHHGSSRLIRHAYGEGENMFRWCCVPSSYGMNWQRSVAKPCLNAPASLTSAPPAPLFSPTSPPAPVRSSLRWKSWMPRP